MTTTIVTVDIGGTHARFALAEVAPGGEITLDEPATLHTRDHASFQTAWEDFARMQGGTLPDAVAIAIAGPVGGETGPADRPGSPPVRPVTRRCRWS